jgi:hypothetical protein
VVGAARPTPEGVITDPAAANAFATAVSPTPT